jgi:hypothetical protein
MYRRIRIYNLVRSDKGRDRNSEKGRRIEEWILRFWLSPRRCWSVYRSSRSRCLSKTVSILFFFGLISDFLSPIERFPHCTAPLSPLTRPSGGERAAARKWKKLTGSRSLCLTSWVAVDLSYIVRISVYHSTATLLSFDVESSTRLFSKSFGIVVECMFIGTEGRC